MKQAFFVLASLALVALLLPAAAQDSAGPKDNTPPAGFTALFNGKDLTGWKDADKQADAWKVTDGLLHYTGKGGRNLATAKNYKDFELFVDWKITKGGDSGIYLRGAPQVQIWDNKEGSGGLWNNKAGSKGKVPLVVADKAPGEWNTFWIKMVGTKVTIKLNDKLVVDDAEMLDGKVKPEGALELQVHGSPLWFKNVYVKELPADAK
jgi:hypothetical protein